MTSYLAKHMDKQLAGEINNISLSFDWVIKKFCINCKEVGECLKSPLFLNSWYLLIYPKGNKEENKEYVSLSVIYCRNVGIKISIELSVMNSKNKKLVDIVRKDSLYDAIHYGKCYQHFVKRSRFAHRKHGLLSGDQLTVQCKMEMSEADFNSLQSSPSAAQLGYNQDEFDDFRKLFDNKELSDVTFIINGQKLLAHKNILLTRSPVFRAMFSTDMKENNDNEVEIEDIEHDVFHELLRFIYTAKIFNIDDMAQELLVAAEKYEIKGLKTQCEKYLSKKLNDENILDCLKFADNQNASILKNEVIEYLKLNADDIIHTTKFELFGIENPKLMYEVFSKIIKNKRQKVDKD